ncbi:MAG: dienelactone hydrolase family protein [Acidimicrobiales bacterium]
MSVVPFALEGFEMQPFTSSSGRRRNVYRMGTGPAVIIIHEMPGITPLVAAFARRVADRGMTAVLPNLLGTAGRPMTLSYALTSLTRACVSKEFTLLALNKTSPIVDYLRDLAKHEHELCGGPGVGAPDCICVPRWDLVRRARVRLLTNARLRKIPTALIPS